MNSKAVKPKTTVQNKNRAVRLLVFVVNRAWLTLIYSLILVAILISLTRLFANQFARYKPELETFLTTKLQRQVTINELKISWPSVGPRIEIKSLELSPVVDHSVKSLSIDNGLIEISFWESLLRQQLLTKHIEFQGVKLSVSPNPTGSSTGSSILVTEVLKTSDFILRWLLNQKTIEVYDTQLNIKSNKPGKKSLLLPTLIYHGSKERSQLKAMLMTSDGNTAELKIEDRRESNPFLSSTQLYFLSSQIDLSKLPLSFLGLQDISSQDIAFSGNLSLETWANWKDNILQKVQLNIESEDLNLSNQTIKMSLAPTTMLWKRHNAQHWSTITTPISLTSENNSTTKKIKPFILEAHNWQNVQQQDTMISGLNIPLNSLSNILLPSLPLEIGSWIKNTKPKGDIKNIIINIHSDLKFPDQPYSFNLSVDLNNLKIKPYKNYPGIDGLNAKLNINQLGGEALIYGENGHLALSPLFRKKIAFTKIDSNLDWTLGDDFQLRWKNFDFKNTDLTISSRGKVDFFKSGGGYMNIEAQLLEANASNASIYLPVSIMQDNLVDYLDRSIKSGKLSFANAIIRGPFSNFPFKNKEGIFDIVAQANNIQFEFLPDWPIVTNLNANLEFVGDKMDILVTQANLQDIELKKATVIIPHFSEANLLLDIQAQADSGKALEVLKQTPIDFIPEALEPLTFSGSTFTDIKLVVDLVTNGALPELEGTVHVKNNHIQLSPLSIPFEKVNGLIAINQSGLQHGNLKGTLWEQDFQFDLNHDPDKPATIFSGNFDSTIDIAGLNHLSKLTLDNLIEGNAKISAALELSQVTESDTQTSILNIDFNSDLNGLSILLPGKLAKPSSVKNDFNLNLKIINDEIQINSQLQDKVLLKAFKKDDWRGGLAIETDALNIPEKSGWLANIYQPEVSFEQWQDIARKITVKEKDFDFKNMNNLAPLLLTLSTENMKLYDLDLGALSIAANFENNLKIELNGPNIKGLIEQPQDTNLPLQISLDKFHIFPSEIVADDEKTSVRDEASKKLTIDQTSPPTSSESDRPVTQENIQPAQRLFLPQHIPEMQLSCKNCQYKEQPVGHLSLYLKPAKEWLGIQGKWFVDDIFSVDLNGSWSKKQTNFSGVFSSKNFEKLTNYWNIASGVKKSAVSSNFTLQWPGAPWDFKFNQLDGSIDSSVTKGYLEEIDTKGSQIFGLLSLQNVVRRLSLDFSDIFNKGFHYNNMNASLVIDNGVAYNRNVKINGTAATIEITGSTDLDKRELEQHIVVTPELTSSLPVLGWAISPATGLIALVVDKLILKPAMDVVTRIDYQLTGKWEETQLIELNKDQKAIQIDTEQLNPLEVKEDETKPVPDPPSADNTLTEEPLSNKESTEKQDEL